tara:strand:- start:1556 stop:2224 length:669 start_codon:yes stop_codon:yes gene_type:complete
MIKASAISKSYDNGDSLLKVLDQISLEVKSGEIITIMGESGAGKSTLLHILGTLDSPDDGIVDINGVNVNKCSKKELSLLRNQEIGFIFQDHYLIPELTLLENILVPTWIKGHNNDSLKYINFLLDFVGLAGKKNMYPSQLSGGERSRVATLRAVVNKPSIVFADEPTGNLDKKNSRLLIELFVKINSDFNHSIVISTHNPVVAEIGNKKLILENGGIKIKK